MRVHRERILKLLPVVLLISLLFARPSLTAPLSRMVLTISPDQVVGQPLQGTGQIILLDSNNQFVTDYDLAANPISLTSTTGVLTPSLLSDTSLLSGGILSFLADSVTYTGLSGKIPVGASNGTISSSNVIVSFSGYDILKVFDFKGDPLTQVYQGLPTIIRAEVRNGGSLAAIANPSLRTYFVSGGGSIKVFFPPHSDGVIDTVSITDTATAAPGPDTLVLELDSRYQLNGNTYQVISVTKVPVTVLTPASIAFVDNSFKPDSAYAGTNFPISFQIVTTGFSGPIDSASALIQLVQDSGGGVVATLFDASPVAASYHNDTITYSGLVGRLDPAISLTPGWYRIGLSYRLISGGSVFTLTGIRPDSLYVLPQNGPSYEAGSLSPGHVAAGAETSFQFKLTVANGELEIEPGTATFSLAGTGFAATVNLVIPNNRLTSGENILSTENIFIPANQLNTNLQASMELHFRLPGAPTYLIYTTNFGGQQIGVEQQPVVQIVSVAVSAPNQPKVNTRQNFEIVAQIANLSTSVVDQVTLRLTSNGSSIDSLLKTVTQIPPSATDTVTFNVMAASQANIAEVFSVDVVSSDARVLPPVDNIAVVTIQNPAVLALTHEIVGVRSGFVTHGAQFTLVMGLTNLYRQGGITPASYHLSTGGVNLGVPPSDTVGLFSDRSPAAFTFTAPSADTTLNIEFSITQASIDQNTGQLAALSDSVFQFSVRVISGEAVLSASGKSTLSVPLVVGEKADLFSLRLANGSSPGASSMLLNSVSLRFSDRLGNLINIRNLFDLSRTGLYVAGDLVSTAVSSDNQLILTLAGMSIPPADSAELTFGAVALAFLDQGMGIRIDSSDIGAKFAGGPDSGQAVEIKPRVPGQPVFSALFSTSQNDFAASFMVQNNPWHPSTGPAQFAYHLDLPAALDFRIFTLTGEEVLEREIAAGMPQTTAGSHVIAWDGKNGDGDIVLNGIYIVSLRNLASGITARLKLAVIK